MNSRIKLMEKLGTCSIIMPYLNHADRSFLLLTRLSRKSRNMLNYNYEGIMNWIMSTAVWLKIENEDQKELLFLPWDLFKFSINLGNNDELIDTFIKFIMNINDLKGYYFKEHYIHKRLWIDKIIINDSKVSKLYPILELLKATKTFI